MHYNRHARSRVIITITLYGTHMGHIFIRVCALIYNGVLPSIFARHLGHQYLPQTAEVIPYIHLDATKQRCHLGHQTEVQMHSRDHSGQMAYRRNKRINQHQPQNAGGCPNRHAGLK